MKKILMVCMGNICRSPIAEGIMRDIILDNKLNAIVDSAGTIDFHKGESPDSRARKKAAQHGVNISGLIARPFQRDDFANFDLIYVMDRDNYNDIISRTSNAEEKKKVTLIMNEVFPGENVNVPDPYFGGEDGFEKVFQMLDNACQSIAKKIEKKQ